MIVFSSGTRAFRSAGLLLAALALTVIALAGGAAPASAAYGVIPPDDPSGLGFRAEVSTLQAGAHPDAVTSFRVNFAPTFLEFLGRGAPLKETVVDYPPGLAGNPQAADKCTVGQMQVFNGFKTFCPNGSQVGVVTLHGQLSGEPEVVYTIVPLYLLEAAEDQIAVLGFKVEGSLVVLEARLRPTDYGIRIITRQAPQPVPLVGATVDVWGVPADASHDPLRCVSLEQATGLCDSDGDGLDNASEPVLVNPGTPREPFFTNPTACDGPKLTSIRVSSWWVDPINTLSDPVTDTDPTPTGCDQLEFNPTIEAEPTTNVADSPSASTSSSTSPRTRTPTASPPRTSRTPW